MLDLNSTISQVISILVNGSRSFITALGGENESFMTV